MLLLLAHHVAEHARYRADGVHVEAFGLFGDASVQEIASILGIGKQQARKHIASLEGKGVCRKLNSFNLVTFRLTEEYSPELTSRLHAMLLRNIALGPSGNRDPRRNRRVAFSVPP